MLTPNPRRIVTKTHTPSTRTVWDIRFIALNIIKTTSWLQSPQLLNQKQESSMWNPWSSRVTHSHNHSLCLYVLSPLNFSQHVHDKQTNQESRDCKTNKARSLNPKSHSFFPVLEHSSWIAHQNSKDRRRRRRRRSKREQGEKVCTWCYSIICKRVLLQFSSKTSSGNKPAELPKKSSGIADVK